MDVRTFPRSILEYKDENTRIYSYMPVYWVRLEPKSAAHTSSQYEWRKIVKRDQHRNLVFMAGLC